jgi:hypothetical protein
LIFEGFIMTGLDEESLEMLKSFLGRDVSHEWGSCRDYMDVYNLHIDDVRELVRKNAGVYVERYIMHLLGKGGLRNAKSFGYYVVHKNENINDWLRDSYQEG